MKRKSSKLAGADIPTIAVYNNCVNQLEKLRSALSPIERNYGHLAVDDRIPRELQTEIEELLYAAGDAQSERDAAYEELKKTSDIRDDLECALNTYYDKEDASIEDDATALSIGVDVAIRALSGLKYL